MPLEYSAEIKVANPSSNILQLGRDQKLCNY